MEKFIIDKKISSGEVDCNGNLKLSSLFGIFQELAHEHANILKFGYYDLKPLNIYWVMSKIKIVFFRYPCWSEELSFVTSPKKPDAVSAYRDYEVRDSSGNIIIAATSTWALINPDNLRPQKISMLNLDLTYDEGFALESGTRIEKVEPIVESDYDYELQVRYSDIDINQHTNNARYIEFIFDGLDTEFFKSTQISEIVVNFTSESRIGDRLRIFYKKITDNKVIVECRKDAVTVFRASIEMKK